MDKIKKKDKEILIKILELLIVIIDKMRVRKESYFLQQNKREALDWLQYLKEHEDKELLRSLEDEIRKRYFRKYNEIELDVDVDGYDMTNENIEVNKIISESHELFGKSFEKRNYRSEYGLDNLRDYLMQLYIEKSGEILK